MMRNYLGQEIPVYNIRIGGATPSQGQAQLDFAVQNKMNQNANAERMMSELKQMSGMGGGAGTDDDAASLASWFGLPAFSGPSGGGFTIEGVGGFQGGNTIPAYQALLDAISRNYASQAQLQGTGISTLGSLLSALGVSGNQLEGTKYGADKSLESSKYGSDTQKAIADIQAGAQRYGADTQKAIAEIANQPALKQLAYKTDVAVPLFRELVAAMTPAHRVAPSPSGGVDVGGVLGNNNGLRDITALFMQGMQEAAKPRPKVPALGQ